MRFGATTSRRLAKAFEQVLLLAKELKLLRLGTVSVDANANKRNSIRYDRAQELRGEIKALLSRAEQEDRKEAVDPQALPGELARHERLRERLDEACAELERRAGVAAAAERASYGRKVSERERRKGSRKGRRIKAPKEEPDGKQQINLTDADSGLMRRSKQHEYRQAYNAQAVVDADGSQMVLGVRVSTNASDRRELVADVDAIPEAVGRAKEVLADNGYATGGEVAKLEQRGMEVLVATTAEWRRQHDFRPKGPPRPQREVRANWIAAMRKNMAQPEKSARYRLRQQTVEPVFGIVKQAMGFRQFLLRGIKKVQGEWGLAMLAYNCSVCTNWHEHNRNRGGLSAPPEGRTTPLHGQKTSSVALDTLPPRGNGPRHPCPSVLRTAGQTHNQLRWTAYVRQAANALQIQETSVLS